MHPDQQPQILKQNDDHLAPVGSSKPSNREGHQISPFEEFLFNFQKERELSSAQNNSVIKPANKGYLSIEQ